MKITTNTFQVSSAMHHSTRPVQVGFLVAKVQVSTNPKLNWSVFSEGFKIQERLKLQETKINTLREVAVLRETYQTFLGQRSLSPELKAINQHLLTCLKEDRKLPYGHVVTNISQLITLESRYSCAAYDLEKISGGVIFRPGHEGEMYTAPSGKVVDLNYVPVLCDEVGPFGGATCHPNRAPVSEKTRALMMVIFDFDKAGGVGNLLARAEFLLQKYAAAKQVTGFVLKPEQQPYALDVSALLQGACGVWAEKMPLIGGTFFKPEAFEKTAVDVESSFHDQAEATKTAFSLD